MADLIISAIPVTATALGPTDLIEIEQGGVSKQAALSLLGGMLLDPDDTLAADSDDVAPSQKAVKAFVADAIAGLAPPGFSIGVRFIADIAATTDADPGVGNLRWNHATQGSATVLFLDDESTDGAALTGLWPALTAGGFLYLQHPQDVDIWQIWLITGVNDASGYAKLTATILVNGGSFADNDPMLVTIEQGAIGVGASTTQTTECISGLFVAPANGDYRIVVKAPHGGTITEVTTVSASGTCTLTAKINTTALGGTANSVSSSEQSQAHSSANVFSAGDDIVLTVSSNSSCSKMTVTIKYTRTLS
ncbi:hypothetical protein [Thermomonas sp.]|uniref:hypothetical protein n=1 Tax=Thermomonas sp. TaxID=1971895 RepID=UPI0035ADEDBA